MRPQQRLKQPAMIRQPKVQQLAHDHLGPKRHRLRQQVLVEGQASSARTTRPLRPHRPDVQLAHLDADTARPGGNLGLKNRRRY